MIETQKFIRKPLYVDAVRVTRDNIQELAEWCQGEVLMEEGRGITGTHIKVRVHNPKNIRQTKAFVGDWLLYTERGYKVYTTKAFYASFDEYREEKQPLSDPRLTGDPVVDAKEPVQAIEHRPISETQVRDTLAMAQARETIVAEGGTLEVATPQAIADVVAEQQPVVQAEEGVLLADSSTAPPVHSNGKRVLTLVEQRTMSANQVRELVQSGEAVLAQDLVD